mmetsp:Transcript_34063/g.75669  ORF Transcript_34063/g.75669 Transcript_34063/m.75669 type:complete len:256 (+) Transcript_34063:86-853(+)
MAASFHSADSNSAADTATSKALNSFCATSSSPSRFASCSACSLHTPDSCAICLASPSSLCLSRSLSSLSASVSLACSSSIPPISSVRICTLCSFSLNSSPNSSASTCAFSAAAVASTSRSSSDRMASRCSTNRTASVTAKATSVSTGAEVEVGAESEAEEGSEVEAEVDAVLASALASALSAKSSSVDISTTAACACSRASALSPSRISALSHSLLITACPSWDFRSLAVISPRSSWALSFCWRRTNSSDCSAAS